LRGVRTVNVVRRAESVAELVALGGDVVLVDGPDLADRVAAATGGSKLRLGIDAIAGDGTQRIAECVCDGGRIVCYGAMSQQACRLDFYFMLFRDVSLCGFSTTRQLQRRTPQQQRELYAWLAELIANGTLEARIAAEYELADGVEAFEHALRVGGDRPGKILLRCR
jgi:NADPH:quinone reductase-like Zn-dependent oxidoreductase